MVSARWQRAIAVLCAVSFVLTSCYSLNPVLIPSGESPPALPAVQVGDTVVVTTKKTTEKKTFVVTAVEAEAVVGKGVRVAYADMTSLSVKRIRKGATTLAVVITVLGILSIIAAAETAEAINDVYDY